MTALHLQVESEIMMLAPLEPLVLELGIWKEQYGSPFAAVPHLTGTERETCRLGSKSRSIRSSPRRQHDQKATQATAKMATLKEVVRSK